MLTTTDDSKQLDRLGNAIRVYHLASGRTLAFAMIKTGRELAFALHKETAKITPSESSLLDLPAKLGWRIHRRFRYYRDGPTPKSSTPWTAADRATFRKIGRRPFKRTSTAMAEIKYRIEKRKFAASGWLPAIRGFVNQGTVTSLEKRLGAVLARVSMTGDADITLINKILKIRKVFTEHPILRKAVSDVMRGFAPYIKRKLGEEARAAFFKL